MVSVPKFPPVPRLSIIVPIGRDLAAFERTLVSVLENRPADSEVLVSHDGTYDDPYQLSDEVRFVVCETPALVPQVATGVVEARGRVIHVLADGICATGGWTAAAMEKFEHSDAAVVAPVIRHTLSGKILAAGWSDGRARLCQAACRGRDEVGTGAPQLVGAYLQASFWRREVIQSLVDAFAGGDPVEASYAYEHLLRAAGWRCVLATECDVLCDLNRLPWEASSLRRGMRLRAIVNHVSDRGWGTSVRSSVGALFANIFRPGLIAEAIGQALSPLAARRIVRQTRMHEVVICEDEGMICPLPPRSGTLRQRKAA